VPEFRQTSFAGGEFSPTLYSRTELDKYGSGLRTARNFLITEHGVLRNRAGTYFIDRMLGKTRLIRFVYSDDQAYVLCFTDRKLRIAFEGALLTVSSAGVPAWDSGAPSGLKGLRVTYGGHVWVTLRNGASVPPDLFLGYWADLGADGATYELPTPYLEADLPRLKFAQSGDVLTIVHGNHAPTEVRRYGHQYWTIEEIDWWRVPGANITLSFGTKDSASPTTAGYSGGTTYGIGQYAQDATGIFMSLQGGNTGHPVSDAGWWGKANDAAHSAKKWEWCVTVSYKDIHGARQETRSTAGAWAIQPGGDCLCYPDRPVKMTWTYTSDALVVVEVLGFNIYKGRDGVYGLVGTTDASSLEFTDDGIVPDYTIRPPAGGAPTDNSYPAAVAYHNQRRFFARKGRIQGSKVADFSNFDQWSPAPADQACDFTLASRHFEETHSLISQDALVALTSAGVWNVRGSGRDEAISPTSILARCGSEVGSSWLDPIVADDTILHVTSKGTRVRQLLFDDQRQRYTGGDLTVYAKHLFEGHTVVDWAYQEEPEHVIWCVLDDGTLASLTFHQEQKLFAWARHDTQGTVEAICCIPEVTEDRVYLVVVRNGVRLLERMPSRANILDVRLGVFVDSGLSYDGRNTGATTLTISDSPWEPGDYATIDASAAIFVPSNFGDAIILSPNGATPYRLLITAYRSPTQVQVGIETTVPVALRYTTTTDWALAANTMSGLSHLEGLAVVALCDGAPEGPHTVVGGKVTLDRPAAIAHVGLGYDQELETLDFVGVPKSNVKAVKAVRLEIYGTRGDLEVGETLTDMQVWDQRRVEHGYGVIPMETLDAIVRPSTLWQTAGRVALRNTEPTPVTLLALTRDVEVGGR
jgi:hypothetical protein